MYSIFYYSLWMKVRQSFLCLFIRSNTILNRSKSCIGWSNFDCLFQHFAILWHGSISTVFQFSFIESLATEIVLVTLSIVATISLATQAQHFWTHEFFFKYSRLSLIMLFVSSTTCSWEEVTCCFRSEAICTISRIYCFPFVFLFSGRIISSTASSDRAKYR